MYSCFTCALSFFLNVIWTTGSMLPWNLLAFAANESSSHRFISILRRALESWHSFRQTHTHLAPTSLLGIEIIFHLVVVCEALENPMSFGRGLRHVPQHSIFPWKFLLMFDSMLLNLYYFQPFHRLYLLRTTIQWV